MTKPIHHLKFFAIPAILSWIVGCAGRDIVDCPTTSLMAASSVLFCEESAVVDAGRSVELVPTSMAITETQSVAKWAREISRSKSISDYPFVGYLVHLIFLDKNKEPVAWVSLLCHRCVVIITPCFKRGERFFGDISPTTRPRIVRSEAFVRDVYEFMQTNMNERLHELRVIYGEAGQDLEVMLFNGDIPARAAPDP